MYSPIPNGKNLSKALAVSSAPLMSEVQRPLRMRTTPVIVQMTRVSIKVCVMETRACFTGLGVLAAAAAIGAEPNPDSLENTPLENSER